MFPTVATDSGAQTSNATSHTVKTCANSHAGDLLLIWFGQDATTGITDPTGFTDFTALAAFTTQGATPQLGGGVWYAIDTGSIPTTLTITTSASERSAHVCARVTNWHGSQAPGAGTPATGTTQNPDPPSVTASWGTADNLFFAVAFTNDGRTWADDPDNYGNAVTASSTGTTGGVDVRVVRRNLASNTDNPNTFDQGTTGNDQNVTDTIVVRGLPNARPISPIIFQ